MTYLQVAAEKKKMEKYMMQSLCTKDSPDGDENMTFDSYIEVRWRYESVYRSLAVRM